MDNSYAKLEPFAPVCFGCSQRRTCIPCSWAKKCLEKLNVTLGHTSLDWEQMQRKIQELEKELKELKEDFQFLMRKS